MRVFVGGGGYMLKCRGSECVGSFCIQARGKLQDLCPTNTVKSQLDRQTVS